jgi:hypothetical protein
MDPTPDSVYCAIVDSRDLLQFNVCVTGRPPGDGLVKPKHDEVCC